VLFFDNGSLYLSDDKNAIFIMTSIRHIEFGEHLGVPCLLDIDLDSFPPPLLVTTRLFLLQATSPNTKKSNEI